IRCRFGGFKLRCGGPGSGEVPTPEQVAFVLAACSDDTGEVPVKFTAGLHHPMRRPGSSPMHGFLNVFIAAMVRFLRRGNEDQLRALLEEERAEEFHFSEETRVWKEHRLGTEEIAALRHGWISSFGSCSFEEPRDDLRSLGLLN